MSGPLAGIRVVELGVWVAGPGAAGILADWGADVVKVEPPSGDPARSFQRMLGGDIDVNPVFELDNRGKRGIALDLSTARGVDVAHRLLDGADAFVTNVRPAALDRLGLGPDQTLERHPHLVYGIITGYGTDGPDAGRAAYDIAAYWARAGIAESLRTPGGPLPFQRGGMGDHTVAMTGAAMVSAALVGRARTGRGQVVSTSLLRQGADTLGFDVDVDAGGGWPMLATPADFDGRSPVSRGRAPGLGQHTREVLAETGLDPHAIDDLLAAGVAIAGDAAMSATASAEG